MSKDENQRQPGGPLAAAVSQASSVIATALTEYLGRTLQAAGYRGVEAIAGGLGGDSRGESVSDSISSVFSQYREALGDLAAVLPQVVQRASQEWRVEPGMRLIFRGRASLMGVEVKDDAERIQRDVLTDLYGAIDDVLLVAIDGQRETILAEYRESLRLRAEVESKRVELKKLGDELANLKKEIPAATSDGTIGFLDVRIAAQDVEVERMKDDIEKLEDALDVIQPPEDWQQVFANRATFDAVKDGVLTAEARASHEPVRKLAETVDKANPNEWAALEVLLKLIGGQFSTEDRRDLPEVLERLKHEIRRSPAQGLTRLNQELQWLHDPKTDECYVLLETLEHSLGSVAVGEVLRRKGLFDKFVVALHAVGAGGQQQSQPSWEAPFRKTFATIGYPLGAALTVLAQNTRERSEFVLLDHAHNRMFGIREGELGFDRKSGREIEIYALREGRSYFTSQALTTPRTLPHRIHDAAVGMGVWTVDRREVQSVLDSDPQRPPVRLRAWDMGANRTPLVLFVVHYRESDISERAAANPAIGARKPTSDEHYELGLGCFVAPRNDPLAMGMMVLGALPVSMEKAKEVGCEIWGYDKVHVSAGDWDVRYRPDAMTCAVKLPDDLTLRVQLPRGGSRSSSRIPLLSYTMKFGQLHRNVLTRSGSGESLRVGGHGVEVSVTGGGEWWKKEKIGGECRSLLTLLYQFGIVRDTSSKGRRAAYSLWTEHLQGEQGPPSLVPATFEREDE